MRNVPKRMLSAGKVLPIFILILYGIGQSTRTLMGTSIFITFEKERRSFIRGTV